MHAILIRSFLFNSFQDRIGNSKPGPRNELFTHALSLITSLIENFELAEANFLKNQGLSRLLPLLDGNPKAVPPELCSEAAQLLFLLSEGNRQLMNMGDEATRIILDRLLAASQDENQWGGWCYGICIRWKVPIRTRVAIAGAILNFAVGWAKPAGNQVDGWMMQAIGTLEQYALAVRPETRLNSAAAYLLREKEAVVAAIAFEIKGKNHTRPGSEASVATQDKVLINMGLERRFAPIRDRVLNTWREEAWAVKQALEILTNWCSGEESDVARLLLTRRTVENVWQLCCIAPPPGLATSFDAKAAGPDAPCPPAVALVLRPEHCQEALNILASVRERAQTCMGNILLFSSKPHPLFEQISKLGPSYADSYPRNVFEWAFAILKGVYPRYQEGQRLALEEAEALTAMMWHILRVAGPYRINFGQKEGIREVNPEVLPAFCELAVVGKSGGVRRNACGVLGYLGGKEQFLSPELNQKIGEALLSVLNDFIRGIPQASWEAVVESLNSLFDVYGEDRRHTTVLKLLNVLIKLTKFERFYRHKISMFRQELQGSLREAVEESLQNLCAFLKYKPNNL